MALDVITALTIGLGWPVHERGRRDAPLPPSGREPSLYLFLEERLPLLREIVRCTRPDGRLQAGYLHGRSRRFIAGERCRRGQAPDRRAQGTSPAGVRRNGTALLHLRSADGRRPARGTRRRRTACRRMGGRDLLAPPFAARCPLRDFRRIEHFFVGQGRHYRDSEDYESTVYATVAADASEALVAGGASPVKTALETLRALRDTLRMAIEFKGLSLASHLDFLANLQSRFARLVAGPPVFRSQQLLALVDAGILKLPFGPSPEVLPAQGGGVLVRSTALEQPFELVVDRLVRAHLDLPTRYGVGVPAARQPCQAWPGSPARLPGHARGEHRPHRRFPPDR